MKNNYKHLLLQAKILLPLRRTLLLASTLLLLLNPPAAAQKKSTFTNRTTSGWGFIKNEGQVASEAGNKIEFYGNLGNFQVFFYKDKVAFVSRKLQDSKAKEPQPAARNIKNNESDILAEEPKILVAKMVMNFKDFDAANVKMQASGNSGSVNNFFLHGTNIRNAATYTQLRYRNIYPNTDLVFKADKSGLKYEFEVRPGGKVSDIKLHWQGADISLENGNLNYNCTLGKLQENQPVSYIRNGQKIPSSFQLKQNTVTFKTGNFNPNETLLIDPLLRWSTYYGGDSTEGANDVATDSEGNVYMLGVTSSINNIATLGSFRDTIAYRGTNDIYLVKFSPEGKRIWSTYYGGISDDYGDCIAIDKNDNIYIGGFTGSLDYISTPGTHQTINARGGPYNKDGFLVKFDSSGNLKWGTYYGGERTDGVTSVNCDKFGDVYITGYTKSTKNIASANGHRTLFAGGSTGNHEPGGDAFLAKFSDKGNLIWGTYYGGAGDEQGFDVATDTEGNVIFAGQAGSTTLIATNGSHQVNRGGSSFNYDGFMAKFDSSGKLTWGTYYGGSQDDNITGIACDKDNNIYISGTTGSNDNIAKPGAYMENYNGLDDIFIARFGQDGKRSWATYFGGKSREDARGIGISEANEIFFTGTTTSSGLATKDAEKQKIEGNADVITGKFDTTGNLIWASYYGGEESDNVQGITVQAKGTFYIIGNTFSTYAIAVIGAYKEIMDGEFDAFLVKYDTLGFCYGLPEPSIFGDTVICENISQSFTTRYDPMYAYRWEVEGGTILLGKYSDSTIIKWSGTGTKSIRVVIINEFACTDSTEINVLVEKAPVADFTASANKICLSDSVAFNAKATNVDYTWDFGDGSTSKQRSPKHKFKAQGTYEVKLIVRSLPGCTDFISREIAVEPLPNASFSIKKISAFTYNLMADDTTFSKYTWKINGLAMYNSPKAKHTFSNNGKYQITLITENAEGCINAQSDSLTIIPNGIEDNTNVYEIDVFPNPFQNITNINISLAKKENISVGLYDASGRFINISKNVSFPKGKHSINIDTERQSLNPGIYMLYIITDDAVFKKKLIKLH